MQSETGNQGSSKKEGFAEEELEKMSPLGKELWALRAKIVASGVPLLTWEQLDEELAERHRYDEEDFDMKLETKPQEDNKAAATKLLSRDEIIQRMEEARARIVASGERLLTSDEVLCEVAANRGIDEDDYS